MVVDSESETNERLTMRAYASLDVTVTSVYRILRKHQHQNTGISLLFRYQSGLWDTNRTRLQSEFQVSAVGLDDLRVPVIRLLGDPAECLVVKID